MARKISDFIDSLKKEISIDKELINKQEKLIEKYEDRIFLYKEILNTTKDSISDLILTIARYKQEINFLYKRLDVKDDYINELRLKLFELLAKYKENCKEANK